MRRIAIVAAAWAVFSTGIAQAAPVAVLGAEAVGVPEPETQAVTEAVRKAAKGRPGVDLMPGKDFVELRFLFGCTDEATVAACMAQAGRSLVADYLIVPSLQAYPHGAKRAKKVEVQLRLLDVGAEKFTREVREVVEPAQIAASTVDATVEALVGELLANGALGAAAPGAAVAQPAKPVAMLSPVKAAETAAAKEPTAAVVPPATTAVEPAPATTGSRGRRLKIAGGVAIALAAVAAGVAIYGGVHVASLESDGAGDLRQVVATSPGYADQQRAWFGGTSGCSAPGAPPSSTQVALGSFQQHCSDGQAWAGATTAMWVVSGALAAGGVAALLLGVRADRAGGSTESAPAKPTASRERTRLVLVPALGPGGGGLSATLSF